MDLITSAIRYVVDFANKSEATYHVNPWIFCILFFGSALPLYYGYYRIGRSVIAYEKRTDKKQAFDKKEMQTGVMISAVAWTIPYLYVILVGDLPWQFWIILTIIIIITGLLFAKTLKTKISKLLKQ